jgi:6-phosphogluconolactonase
MIKKIVFIFLLAILFGFKKEDNRTYLFVGCYTDKKPGKGIQVYEFNTKTGEMHLTYTVDDIINSSFLRLSPNGKYLYAVLESQMEHNGKVAAFSVDAIQGKVTLLNTQDSGGRNPVHLEIDQSGKNLIASHYADPVLCVFPINGDGSLNSYSQKLVFEGSSIVKGNQDAAHIHSSNFSPDGTSLFAQDLGSDKIRKFKVDQNNDGTITLNAKEETDVKKGSGPRHFTFHPNTKLAYGISELNGTLVAYSFKKGKLAYLADYPTYNEKQEKYSSADIHLSPDGKFIYATNRGIKENSIAVFSINTKDGKLTFVENQSTFGEHPRNFAIDPSGNFLLVANQFSNNVVVFKRDMKTGKLTKLPGEVKINSPSSLQMRTY